MALAIQTINLTHTLDFSDPYCLPCPLPLHLGQPGPPRRCVLVVIASFTPKLFLDTSVASLQDCIVLRSRLNFKIVRMDGRFWRTLGRLSGLGMLVDRERQLDKSVRVVVVRVVQHSKVRVLFGFECLEFSQTNCGHTDADFNLGFPPEVWSESGSHDAGAQGSIPSA